MSSKEDERATELRNALDEIVSLKHINGLHSRRIEMYERWFALWITTRSAQCDLNVENGRFTTVFLGANGESYEMELSLPISRLLRTDAITVH